MKRLRGKLEYKYLGISVVFCLFFCFFLKREILVKVVYQSLVPSEAALLAGMLWGGKENLGKELYRNLTDSGLLHLVVVSGTNLTIISRSLVEFLAKIIGRYTAIVVGMMIALTYINIVGWQIPVIRAELFMGFYFGAQFLGRQFKPLKIWLVVGVLMFFANFKIVNEVSFWLSMMAFLAVLTSSGKNIIKTNLWVNLVVTPIIAFKFGSIGPWSILVNLGVLFMVEILTILGFVGSLLGLIILPVGKIVLSLCYPFLRYLVEIVNFFGQGGAIKISFNVWMLLGWYLLLGVYWYEKIRK